MVLGYKDEFPFQFWITFTAQHSLAINGCQIQFTTFYLSYIIYTPKQNIFETYSNVISELSQIFIDYCSKVMKYSLCCVMCLDEAEGGNSGLEWYLD